jgi:sulfur-carrier protein adenylyltransferase/sulfurtransferase
MPNQAGIMARCREEGISKADSFLLQECGARRLPDSEAQCVEGRDLVAGWQLVLQTPASRRRVNVCVDQQFPFSLPQFFLLDRPPLLTWPHVEEDGLLCLLSRSAVVKFRQPAEVIGELLRDAYRLICDCESGANQSDFRTEFYSYWNRGLSTEEEKLRSLLVAGGPSRLVQIWRGKTRSVVGEREAQVLSWLRNLHGDKPQFNSTDAACLLWIKDPLLPGEYPKTAADLYRIAGSVSGGTELLESFAKLGSSPFYFLIGAESGNGPCLAAVRTHKPVSKDVRGKIRDRTNNGFRPGKVPPQLQTQRLFSSDASANRMQVERVDAEWIHGRGQDPTQKELRAKTVLLFGGGSVGAPVGHQLAMAGVGHIMTVDPANLSWANVGRHPLGADHVGERKAIALAETWRKAYPHARFEGFDSTAHRFLTEHPELVAKADLIICATADWKAELELNLRQRAGEIVAPILYAWTEPNACAGHAVLIFPGSACFQCGFSLSGDCKLQVTAWPGEKKQQMEPACGAIFQPYGPIELLGTISVAASLALGALLGRIKAATHRIWAGPESSLTDAGGIWSKEWINGNMERGKGGFQEERVWERDPLCDVCGGSDPVIHLSSKSENPNNVSSSTLPS